MALVQVQVGVAVRQIDDFPKDCERSRKGALYVRPRSTLILTAGELKHLRAKHKDIASKLIVVGVEESAAKPSQKSVEPPKKKAKAKAKAEPKEASEKEKRVD